jgi:hypothetical protein
LRGYALRKQRPTIQTYPAIIAATLITIRYSIFTAVIGTHRSVAFGSSIAVDPAWTWMPPAIAIAAGAELRFSPLPVRRAL